MLELLIGINITQKPIDILLEQQIVIVAPVEQPAETPPELTLEEKIKLDVNKCEPAQWISAEDASCIPKTVQTPVKTAVKSPTAPAGWYPKGQCTWWVWTKRPVGLWNDATDWKWQAQRDGYTVSNVPVAGAIGWEYGHVVYVESVNGDGTVTISEANYDNRGSVRVVTRPVSSYTYIY